MNKKDIKKLTDKQLDYEYQVYCNMINLNEVQIKNDVDIKNQLKEEIDRRAISGKEADKIKDNFIRNKLIK